MTRSELIVALQNMEGEELEFRLPEFGGIYRAGDGFDVNVVYKDPDHDTIVLQQHKQPQRKKVL